ncbi:hypothetical protein HPB52_017429 [Rhipicephalus sanguineus]|uniref:Uncharacterized protein n=1 Tax=Rhipicephalus sanguineus TaxID=34632 RepID=A0A9D4PDK0_RHISA|nr:hypothetical protein HPB52_017429 [Rhipicephalus sanguineus]
MPVGTSIKSESASADVVQASDDAQTTAGASANPTESATPEDDTSQDASRYLLIGFRSPLRGRCVQFAQPLSGIAVCSGCNLLPLKDMLLPCSHILCLSCRDNCLVESTGLTGDDDTSRGYSEPEVWCPVDWAPRSAFHLWPVVLDLERVRGEVAFCVNSESGCPFKAQLRHVEKHYTKCRYRRRTHQRSR